MKKEITQSKFTLKIAITTCNGMLQNNICSQDKDVLF